MDKSEPAYSVNLPKPLNRKIGRAMHDWGMLTGGDRVLVAVSGGVDSLVTAWILEFWRAKAPIDYHIEAVYIENGFHESDVSVDSPGVVIGRQMQRFGIPFSIVRGQPMPDGEQRSCYLCARNRRTRLFEIARTRGCTKLALGHHKDDLVETFFLNALYSGNISTMLPRQDLFDGRLGLIRILAYLEKHEIKTLAQLAGIMPVVSCCPLSGDTRRETIRGILEGVYKQIPGAKSSVFSALGNIRDGYML